MGTKQSKIEDQDLPATPAKILTEISVTTDYDDMNNSDPRSPNICRTPLNKLIPNENEENFDNIPEEPITPIQPLNSGSFKKRLLKGLKCSNIFDPRSPSTFINRTPIIFNDNTIENINPADKSLNLNDTFSDLFIDVPDKHNEISKESTRIEETSVSMTNKMKLDPRSPTIGVDRTPIIFNDDNAPDENLMIESVLEKLKLNQSQKPRNKPLERIKKRSRARIASASNKIPISPRRKTRSTSQIASASKTPIYTDNNEEIYLTPKKSTATDNLISDNNLKRTPLGCVANKPHSRSKSSENTIKNTKLRPLINSFDDYNLKNLQNDIGNIANNENNSSMNNFIAKVN